MIHEDYLRNSWVLKPEVTGHFCDRISFLNHHFWTLTLDPGADPAFYLGDSTKIPRVYVQQGQVAFNWNHSETHIFFVFVGRLPFLNYPEIRGFESGWGRKQFRKVLTYLLKKNSTSKFQPKVSIHPKTIYLETWKIVPLKPWNPQISDTFRACWRSIILGLGFKNSWHFQWRSVTIPTGRFLKVTAMKHLGTYRIHILSDICQAYH